MTELKTITIQKKDLPEYVLKDLFTEKQNKEKKTVEVPSISILDMVKASSDWNELKIYNNSLLHIEPSKIPEFNQINFELPCPGSWKRKGRPYLEFSIWNNLFSISHGTKCSNHSKSYDPKKIINKVAHFLNNKHK